MPLTSALAHNIKLISASFGIPTLDLLIMRQEFYHCATVAQPSECNLQL